MIINLSCNYEYLSLEYTYFYARRKLVNQNVPCQRIIIQNPWHTLTTENMTLKALYQLDVNNLSLKTITFSCKILLLSNALISWATIIEKKSEKNNKKQMASPKHYSWFFFKIKKTLLLSKLYEAFEWNHGIMP